MVAFDTNYLVRHLVQDDPRQSKLVAQTIEKEAVQGRTILLFDLVLCETVWVLKSAYGAKKADLVKALRELERESCFEFENPEQVKLAINGFENGRTDFSDCLLIQHSKSIGRELLSFDKVLIKELQNS